MKPVSWKSAFPLSALILALSWLPTAAAADFAPCADAATRPELHGTLCARVAVPPDYETPDTAAARLTLFVRKFPAGADSKGSVWLVAGGPGESGASLYPFVGVLRRSFPQFDLIVPDHRGTGYSSRLCPREEAVESEGGAALAGAEWGSCLGRLAGAPALAAQFSVTNAAHDLKRLIEQQGSSRPVYIYGVSYGTQLVLRTMQLGPLPVKGLVLDSLVPLETDPRWDLSRRSFVVDGVGRQVLARCDAEPRCAATLGAPAETTYRRLLAQAKADPRILDGVPGKDLPRFLGALLDLPTLRERIPYLIQDLAQGRTRELDAVLAELPRLQASLGDFPQTPPSIPLVGIISASENDLRPGLDASALAQEESPLLFTSALPGLLASSTLPRYARDRHFGRDPVHLPPTLVLQGTLDPKTHYDGARLHAAALRERGQVSLASITDAPHFILWVAPDCFEREVSAFVAGKRVGDTRCPLHAGDR
jgi:pimeloyl-ACP methyl ester carboxylesterase